MARYSEPYQKVFNELRKDQNSKIKLSHGLNLLQRESTNLLRNSTQILPKDNWNQKNIAILWLQEDGTEDSNIFSHFYFLETFSFCISQSFLALPDMIQSK